ncbi:transcription antitermination factor NusB [Buchananella hordeovulneris]|uniref:Transcription antitermination protein NusB n=1 Tax=Buchananella hordeovulneris TaxID=52770 RepID=A0A1Q5PYA2_9ACTO|nr:transcription antitermination factor NusB [Buchananella hordeovulneris]MDO5079656.1 transcription antitermination factor NusB [Buchananella hordeovulneris]OKL52429.1 transcription antitermination factor NusB [Buchananella hordeovulneris]RRD45380.1 transcription antitermination factor NusB [Buchananella hordeovulneris]RRD53859.1 transcription antitermination factor NusB [Buchananella hordeovulneris]
MADARSKARRRAVEVLFEAETVGALTSSELAALAAARRQITAAHTPLPAFAQEILAGVAANLGQIDDVLNTYQTGKAISRLPQVDRAILRVGVWELLFADTPPNVAIDEAVNLAALLSTDESPPVVNGLLGRIKDLAPTLRS